MSGRFPRILFLVLLGVVLARYVVLACYVHPFADDFSYAVAGMRTELLPRLWDEYNLWNGRWFSNILVLRGPLVLGMERGLALYRTVPVLLMLLTWVCSFSLVRAFAPRLERWRAATAAGVFLVVFLQLMPDLSEGVYWYTGAVTYLLPGALLLLLLSCWVLWSRPSGEAVGMGRAIVLGALGAVIAGCNEVHMVLLVLGIAAVLVVRSKALGRIDRSVLAILAIVVLAALVMVLAPGNAGRGGQFPLRHQFFHSLGWGALQTARFLASWALSPTLLLVSVLYLINLRTMKDGLVFTRSIGPWSALALVVVPVFFVMVLPYWSTGLLGQHRTVNAALLFVLPCWFIALAIWDRHWFRSGTRVRPVVGRSFERLVQVILLFVLFFTGSGGRVSHDLWNGNAQAFDAALMERYERIEQARDEGATEVVLPRPSPLPESLRYLDASPDPGQWINRSLAYYFYADTMAIVITDR